MSSKIERNRWKSGSNTHPGVFLLGWVLWSSLLAFSCSWSTTASLPSPANGLRASGLRFSILCRATGRGGGCGGGEVTVGGRDRRGGATEVACSSRMRSDLKKKVRVGQVFFWGIYLLREGPGTAFEGCYLHVFGQTVLSNKKN